MKPDDTKIPPKSKTVVCKNIQFGFVSNLKTNLNKFRKQNIVDPISSPEYSMVNFVNMKFMSKRFWSRKEIEFCRKNI